MPHTCTVCGEEATRRCSRCKCAHYCDRTCQLKDWHRHKRMCAPDVTCSVCLDNVSPDHVELLCGHKFCTSCIHTYCDTSTSPTNAWDIPRCPMCRHPMGGWFCEPAYDLLQTIPNVLKKVCSIHFSTAHSMEMWILLCLVPEAQHISAVHKIMAQLQPCNLLEKATGMPTHHFPHRLVAGTHPLYGECLQLHAITAAPLAEEKIDPPEPMHPDMYHIMYPAEEAYFPHVQWALKCQSDHMVLYLGRRYWFFIRMMGSSTACERCKRFTEKGGEEGWALGLAPGMHTLGIRPTRAMHVLLPEIEAKSVSMEYSCLVVVNASLSLTRMQAMKRDMQKFRPIEKFMVTNVD